MCGNEIFSLSFSSSAATYEKMVSMLAQIEFSMEKKLLIHNMNEKEMKNYEIIYQKIGEFIMINFFECSWNWKELCLFYIFVELNFLLKDTMKLFDWPLPFSRYTSSKLPR